MILKHIEASNILKYRRLRLTDLPPHGQIAVAGQNEGGKTAIGETVCFALFGRTFSLGPRQLDQVIRWGEFNASVRVTFEAPAGDEYTVVREIDNTGKHEAWLFDRGGDQPIAEGVDSVADAIYRLGGFSFQSYIDSFYLAQREMEVPHAKSATVKALIGVDKLEAVAEELQQETESLNARIHALDHEIHGYRKKITAFNIDRGRLGRLEADGEAQTAAADAAQRESVSLRRRAATIGDAADAFAKATASFAKSTLCTSYGQWCDRRRCMAATLSAVAKASQLTADDAKSQALTLAEEAVGGIATGLGEYDKIRNLAGLYRGRLAELLDDRSSATPPGASTPRKEPGIEESFHHRRTVATGRVETLSRQRKVSLVAGIFAAEVALLTWTGWIAPTSMLGGWLRFGASASGDGRSILLLLSAIGSTVAFGVLAALFVRSNSLRRLAVEALRSVYADERIARAELAVIEEIDQVPVPQALEALGCVRNDLLRSAVASFQAGDGAVLIKEDALSQKLEQIRAGGAEAVRSIRRGQQRVLEKEKERTDRAKTCRQEVERLEGEIAAERKRWHEVQVVERKAAALESKAGDLRHQVIACNVAGHLIAGACRQIYARFHPELGRFVGKILPHLTEERYEHLEVDDDLRVRVFCQEKNDFVGLAEISNGTHRQLMLCVRLALCQALIASSCNAAQFVFFDEPFAFFDERRMAKAIDVLGKISPQITQVWLAAQRFGDLSAFDMVLESGVDQDCLEASGTRRTRAIETEPKVRLKARMLG